MAPLMTESSDYVLDDFSWLGSADGTQATESGTLDISLFDADTHYPDGFIRSGTPLGKVTATGLYGPFTAITEEVQTFTISGSPTGGSFTITFAGQTTGAIAYNASAATFLAALEALSNVDAGDFTVVRSGSSPNYVYTVSATDSGQYADTNLAQMSSTDSLTGGTSPAVADATSTAGGTESASDGTEVLEAFLYGMVPVAAGQTSDEPCAVLTRGKIRESNLPLRVSTAAKADVASRFRFI